MSDLDALAAAAGGTSPVYPSYSPPEPSEWSVYWMGQTYGPYTLTEIRSYVATGQFPAAAQASRPGMSGWVPVATVAATIAAAPPPPTPYGGGPWTPSPSPPLAIHAARARGFMAGWKAKSGGRSFVFQMVFLGWTTLIGLLVVAQTVSISTRKPERWERASVDRDYDNEIKGAAVFVSWTCLGGIWLLIALPCGIAAIATYEGGNNRRF